MRIWLFRWDEPLPFDKSARQRRAGILAAKLNAHGHDVVWWTTNFNHFIKKIVYKADGIYNIGNHLSIVTLKSLSYSSNLSLIRLLSQSVSGRHFRKMQSVFAIPDLLIVHYPAINLAWQAIRYAKKYKIPVIVDVRDMWPDTFVRVLPSFLQPLGKLILTRSFNMKNEIFREADVLISMSQDILDWATRTSKRKAADLDQVFYLGAPKPNAGGKAVRPEITSWLESNKDKFICAYVGTFGRSYNLLSVVRAAKIFKETGRKEFAFILAGDGPCFKAVSEAAVGLDLMYLPGWTNADEMSLILQKAKVALIPVNDTTPEGVMCNKLFDYAAAGKPIISSVDGEMRSFISTHLIGSYYRDDQEMELVSAITDFYDHPEKISVCSNNCEQLFVNSLNADLIYENYVRLAEQVAVSGVAVSDLKQ